MAGTTNVMVEMLHKWYEATDVMGNFVRVLFLDYRKAFDVVNHDTLIDILITMELPATQHASVLPETHYPGSVVWHHRLF